MAWRTSPLWHQQGPCESSLARTSVSNRWFFSFFSLPHVPASLLFAWASTHNYAYLFFPSLIFLPRAPCRVRYGAPLVSFLVALPCTNVDDFTVPLRLLRHPPLISVLYVPSRILILFTLLCTLYFVVDVFSIYTPTFLNFG